jgi:hypothetical protein
MRHSRAPAGWRGHLRRTGQLEQRTLSWTIPKRWVWPFQRTTTTTGSLPLSKSLLRTLLKRVSVSRRKVAHRYSGDDSQSGCGTQANTYSDRTRSQGASSDPGEGSLERRLSGRQLYRSAQSIRDSGHPRRISVCLSRRPLLFRLRFRDGVPVELLSPGPRRAMTGG